MAKIILVLETSETVFGSIAESNPGVEPTVNGNLVFHANIENKDKENIALFEFIKLSAIQNKEQPKLF